MGCAMNDKLTYLRRAFGRLCEEAVQSAQKGRLRVMAEATSRGALHSGGTLISVNGEYDRAANETTDKMVRLAFDVTGDTSEPTCAVVEEGLTALRDAFIQRSCAILQRADLGAKRRSRGPPLGLPQGDGQAHHRDD